MTKSTMSINDRLTVGIWTIIGVAGGIWAAALYFKCTADHDWANIFTGAGFFLAGLASVNGFISDWESRERDAELAERIEAIAAQLQALAEPESRAGRPSLFWRVVKAFFGK